MSIVTVLIDHSNQFLPEPHASLLAGMLFGVKRTLPADFYDALITTGTVHLIALSGMNINIIIRLVFDTFSRFSGRLASVLITLFAIVGFVLLVGPSPSIVRASIMGSLTIIAAFLGRKPIALISLLVTGLIMLFIDISVVGDISFQLSFFATLGIILFANSSLPIIAFHSSSQAQGSDSGDISSTLPKKYSLVQEVKNVLVSDLKVTLAAQFCTLPIILWHFRQISLVAPLANIAVGWLVPSIMYGGILLTVCSFIFPPVAYIIGLLLWVPLTVFIYVITQLSKAPFASVEF